MAKKNNEPVSMIYVMEGDTLKTVQEKVRKYFKYANEPLPPPEEWIPLKDVIAELEEVERKGGEKKKRKPKLARKRHRPV